MNIPELLSDGRQTFSTPGPNTSRRIAITRVFLPAPEGPYTNKWGKSGESAWGKHISPVVNIPVFSQVLLKSCVGGLGTETWDAPACGGGWWGRGGSRGHQAMLDGSGRPTKETSDFSWVRNVSFEYCECNEEWSNGCLEQKDGSWLDQIFSNSQLSNLYIFLLQLKKGSSRVSAEQLNRKVVKGHDLYISFIRARQSRPYCEPDLKFSWHLQSSQTKRVDVSLECL